MRRLLGLRPSSPGQAPTVFAKAAAPVVDRACASPEDRSLDRGRKRRLAHAGCRDRWLRRLLVVQHTPQIASNSFFDRKPAIRPAATLKGVNRSFITRGNGIPLRTLTGRREPEWLTTRRSATRRSTRAATPSPDDPTDLRSALEADPEAHGQGVPGGQPHRLGRRADLLRDARAVPGAAGARRAARAWSGRVDDRRRVVNSHARAGRRRDNITKPLERRGQRQGRSRRAVHHRPRGRDLVGLRLHRRVHARVNAIYEVEEGRPFWKLRPLQVG